jgi:hypothetical protein
VHQLRIVSVGASEEVFRRSYAVDVVQYYSYRSIDICSSPIIVRRSLPS